MSAPTAGAARPAARTANAPEESTFRKLFNIAQQAFIIWAITQFAMKFFGQSKTPAPQVVPNSETGTPINPFDSPPVRATLAWPLGESLAMHVYLSTSPAGGVFSPKWTSSRQNNQDNGLPSFIWDNITFGDWKEARTIAYDVVIPEAVKQNGSLWADVFLTRNSASPDPSHAAFYPQHVHHVRKLLTPYLPKVKVRKEKSLLKDSEKKLEEEPQDIILPHWHSNVTLGLVSDNGVLQYSALPPVITEHVHLVPGVRDHTGTEGVYQPIVFANDFWHLRSQYVEINSTTTTLPIQFVFQPMSFMKFQMFVSMTHGFNEAAKQQGKGASAELDEIKRMLVETNPWFLGITALVSILHVIFEMLAFKSDVSHWRHKKELVGVSLRTILTNVFIQTIVLLYLIDNNSDTSWMILFGSGTGVLIEAWKITKVVDIHLVNSPPGSLLPYKVDIKDKHVLSEDEKKTQEFDKLAFRYVSYVAWPTLAGYSIYSLLYETHKGWYSFVITTLTSFVYMFGFAQLIPQLIINYKLKSVAHMPMKAMVYKTLSTVVDDFFAFCIKMPFLHRLACFRDDAVFLVYLYQRWIYRIDKSRVNEYGQVLTEGESDPSGESKKTK